MKPYVIYAVIFLTVLAGVAGARPVPAGGDSTAANGVSRDLSEQAAAAALDLIFQGRPHQSLAYIRSFENRSHDEPLFLIMRARCYQEFIPMDDANKAAGRRLSQPALDDLDRCIRVCSERLETDATNTRLYFYRGWAWMAKAYVRSMTRDMYSAGKEAKRGKKDLERYLETHPDDATAKGMLGAFLYFADTIPAAFKVISRILMLPTGDREKGLEYLQSAAANGGLLETDWRLILYNVYFYFEGRFEEGLAGLQEMIEEYPQYARTAIPLAASRPYAPRFVVQNDQLVDTSVNSMYGAPHREVDWNALYLVQLFRAYGDRYCSHSSTTISRLRSIIHESPRHPDWVEAYAKLELGRIYASKGDRDNAVAMFESVSQGRTFAFLRKDAESLLEDVTKYSDRFNEPTPDLDRWVAALYRSDPDSIVAMRARFSEFSDRSVPAAFYTAECDLLSGDFEAAVNGFERVIATEQPGWDEGYQMIAASRIAEIYAASGQYRTASRYQGTALGYYHNEYLIDWVLEGRQRYFERLGDGQETVPPTLLSANVGRMPRQTRGTSIAPAHVGTATSR